MFSVSFVWFSGGGKPLNRRKHVGECVQPGWHWARWFTSGVTQRFAEIFCRSAAQFGEKRRAVPNCVFPIPPPFPAVQPAPWHWTPNKHFMEHASFFSSGHFLPRSLHHPPNRLVYPKLSLFAAPRRHVWTSRRRGASAEFSQVLACIFAWNVWKGRRQGRGGLNKPKSWGLRLLNYKLIRRDVICKHVA